MKVEPVLIGDVWWYPFSVTHQDADGKVSEFYIWATNDYHAACVVSDIRDNAELGGRVEGVR